MSKIDENKKNNKNNTQNISRANSTINEGKNIILMKKGDYSIHILIEEIKSLIQMKEDHLPYPIVKLTCFNQTKRTEKTKVPCDNYIYDEHFYFEKTDLTVEQLDSSKILIEVYDSSNSRKKKDYFGIYEFDLEYIYSMKNHSLNNHWIALSNPESKDISKTRGYLKLSISVLHDNDPRVELKSFPESTNFLIPSEIKRQYKQLKIYLIKAEELPDMDSIINKKGKNRKCDPFVEFKYFGLNLQSKITENINDVATWNQIIYLPVEYPVVSQKIVILVKDYDKIGHNDNLGSYEINVNDIIGRYNKYKNYRYIDIYGSLKNNKDKINNLMNTNAEIGSSWNGRILLKIECEDSNDPVIKKIDIKDENELKIINSIVRKNLWTIHIKLYCAYYLPKEYKKYSIKITMQDKVVVFSEKKTINEFIEWKVLQSIQFYSVSDDKDELPDLFFYLLNPKAEPICYQRIKCSLFHLNDQIMIIKLYPEPSYSKETLALNSGLIKAKIVLYDNQKEKNEINLKMFKDGDSVYNNSVEDLEQLNESKSDYLGIGAKLKDLYYVVCVVYMCRYLISSDSNGSNDPYVRLTCVDEKRESTIKYETINGIWNEALVFNTVELDLKRKSTWPIILTEVLDYDKIGKDDLLGITYIWVSDSPHSINDTKPVKPTWHQLYLPKSNRPQGEILLSFYIFDQEHKNMVREINPIPETVPYYFEINILGLRDIKPLAMLPIKKPFIKFDMNSLNVTGNKEDSLPERTTQPKDKGSNPTINYALKFDLKLPKDEIFLPHLQCEVFDYIFSGINNPTLGLFILNIKNLVMETNRQIEEDEKITKVKLGFYLAKGMITNSQGNIGELDRVNNNINNNENIINTSSKQNDININNEEENIKEEEIIAKLAKEKETKVNTKIYNAEFIEKNKNISEYFVVLPQYKNYFIPGTKENKGNRTPYLIEDESKSPSKEYYFPVGYNPTYDINSDISSHIKEKVPTKIENITKHYRRFYNEGLEDVKELKIISPFYTAYLRRGKDKYKKDETEIFTAMSELSNKIIKTYEIEESVDDHKTFEEKEKIKKQRTKNLELFGLLPKQQSVDENYILPRNLMDRGFGKFKAVIRICEKSKMDKYLETIDKFRAKDEKIIKELKNVEKYENLTKSILLKHEVIIRIYILELRDLPKKDLLSDSDPYIKIFFGDKKKFDEKKNHQNDKKITKWYKYYDILTEFPGDSTLRIEVWDFNPIFKDELIGVTSIDLEDRYFNHEWQQMKFKPIETRPLKHPDLSGQQGNILLWIEIFDKKDLINMTPWQINPEASKKVEIRLIVWETKEMKMMDTEDTSDVYVTAFIDQKKRQNTDVHFRCQTGEASFNWRMVFQLEVPRINNILTLHCYDKDIFSKDDFISGARIDLSDIIKIPKNFDVPITFSKEYVESVPKEEKMKYEGIEFLTDGYDKEKNKFWIDCYRKTEKSGKILCSLEILPMWKAEFIRVGLGRKEPNEHPYLPPPYGRFKWSYNPIKLFNQCIGPRFRKKVYCTICLTCLVLYLVFLIPSLIYHLVSEIVNPFNYINLAKNRKKKD